MSKSEYQKHLTSDKWREFSSSIRHERGNKCEFCGKPSGVVNLHCHHMTYDNFGFEEKEDVLILCESDHAFYHKQFKSREMPKMGSDKLRKHVFDVLRKQKNKKPAKKKRVRTRKGRVERQKTRKAEPRCPLIDKFKKKQKNKRTKFIPRIHKELTDIQNARRVRVKSENEKFDKMLEKVNMGTIKAEQCALKNLIILDRINKRRKKRLGIT